MTTKTEITPKAFKMLSAGMISETKAIISENYPFKPMEKKGRTYRECEKIKTFLRDGFVDRYSGERLVFPPVLRTSLPPILCPPMSSRPCWKNWMILKSKRPSASDRAKNRSRYPSMPCKLAFKESALKEWGKLDRPIREQFKKKLAKRLERPRVEADRVNGKRRQNRIEANAE